MLIWRGYGQLAVLFGVLPLLLVLSIDRGAHAWPVGLALVAGGVGCWFTGQHLNQTLGRRRAEPLIAQRGQEIDAMVASGRYVGINGEVPRSLDEARMLGDHQYASDAAAISARHVNRHTLYGVPMQYWGVLGMALGLIVLVGGLLT